MSSADASDLTARARIRDAAIEHFGRHGFKVTIRAIAEKAGVSPGLVMHHFGSKDGLRKACDDHVFEIVHRVKKESVTADPAVSLQHVAHIEEFAPLLAYAVRSFQEGGSVGLALYERMVADIRDYLAAGEAAGRIRPSRDPGKRARWLAESSMGSLLVALSMRPDPDDIDFPLFLREWMEEHMLPLLELYTEGLYTDRQMLDAYLLYVGDPPAGTR
ncbi:TetR/AcrR family transcriptional regulator [Nocardiopsis sp. CC223A]|uniref:TetR/AcrR family transcriptional regulator n=1 Tax=Nocardiopsis sp. CC223A TaxID=3044051 RepID=UPI00278BEFC4|nr:TetR family transcriptional regulator [Nocardiopsis sp. CC223A]